MSVSPFMKHVEPFIVKGFSVRTQNKDEFNGQTAKLPGVWQRFHHSDLASNTKIFGVYSSYDSDANGPYTFTVGVASPPTPDQLSTVTIQKGDYLVFEGSGPIPSVVFETWKRVWAFFETHTEYQRNYISDFEAYTGSEQIAIHIGVAYVSGLSRHQGNENVSSNKE